MVTVLPEKDLNGYRYLTLSQNVKNFFNISFKDWLVDRHSSCDKHLLPPGRTLSSMVSRLDWHHRHLLRLYLDQACRCPLPGNSRLSSRYRFSAHLSIFCAEKDATSTHWTVRILGITLLSGFFLALHFAFWVRSVQMTSIASSATLVSTTPLFVALFGHFCRGEQLQDAPGWDLLVNQWQQQHRREMTFISQGTLSAVTSWLLRGPSRLPAIFSPGVFVRRTLDLATYTLGAYGSAALFLLVFNLATATPLSGFSNQTYLVLMLLAVIPQLIGHTTFNWTLGFLSPRRLRC